MSVIGHGVEIVPSALQLPSSPVEGSLVYQLDINSVLFWDGTNWIALNNPVEGTPIGSLIDYSGTTAPTGWLLANGDVVPNGNGTVQGITANFSALYSVVGSTYGSAGKLPDFRGRVSAGKDNMGGSAASRLTSAGSGITGTTLGSTGGSETHTLTTSQLAAHNHGVNDSGHVHYIRVNSFAGDRFVALSNQPDGQYYNITDNADGQGDGSNSARILYADNRGTNISIQNNGSNSPHQNMPPTIIVNKIIRYLA